MNPIIFRKQEYAASQANAYHKKVLAAHESTLKFAKMAGEALWQARKDIKWKFWGKWLDNNFEGSSSLLKNAYLRTTKDLQ